MFLNDQKRQLGQIKIFHWHHILADLSGFKADFRTQFSEDIGFPTRVGMSAFGYKQTFLGRLIYVRF